MVSADYLERWLSTEAQLEIFTLQMHLNVIWRVHFILSTKAARWRRTQMDKVTDVTIFWKMARALARVAK